MKSQQTDRLQCSAYCRVRISTIEIQEALSLWSLVSLDGFFEYFVSPADNADIRTVSNPIPLFEFFKGQTNCVIANDRP